MKRLSLIFTIFALVTMPFLRPQDAGATQCMTDAGCDDGIFCNGVETCDAGGNCQAGSNPCAAGQSCDETNGCMAGPECLADADCDDGTFCNGAETCAVGGACQAGANPCAAGETCSEANGCISSPVAGGGAALFSDNCASCHGTDGSGGTSGEDIRGESASEIREAIVEVPEMDSLDFLTFDETEEIALFLVQVQRPDDMDDMDDQMDNPSQGQGDHDGDGMSDDEEGFLGADQENEDVDKDGTPDYQDPTVTHFPSDNDDGSMVLTTQDGALAACSTVDETKGMSDQDKPQDVDFKWGFIDFMVKDLTPNATVEVTLIMPKDLPADAHYWKYDGTGYHEVDSAVIEGREVTLTLTDDDGDGIIVDPGAVGVPVSASSVSSGSGGGGGCVIYHGKNLNQGFDPAILLILLIPFLFRRRSHRKEV